MDDEDYLPSPRRVLVSQHHNGGDINNGDGEDGAAVSTYYTVTGRRGDDDSVGGISSIGSESGEVLQPPPPAVKQDVFNRASADGNIAASPTTKNNNINAEDSVHRDRALNLLFGSLKLSKTKSERSNASAGGGGGSTSRISSHSDATKKGDTTTTSQQPIIHPTLSKMTSPQISQLEFRLRELRASSNRTKSGGDGQNVDGVHLTSSTTSSSKRTVPTTTQPPLLQRQTSANAPLLGSSSSDDDESPPPPDDENDDGGGMYGGRTGSLHAQQAISRSHSKSSSVAAAPCVSHSTKLRQQHQQSSSTSVRKNLVDMKPVSRTTSRNSAAPSLKATTTAATIVPAAGRTASGRSTTSNNESNTPLSAPANTVITSRLASGDVIKIPSKLFPTSTTITTTNAAKKTPSSTSLGVTSRVVSRLDSLGEKQSAALEKARLRRVDSVASSVAVAGADVRPTASTRSNASSDHHSHHHVDAAIKSLSDRMKRRDTAASDEEEEDGILSDTIVPTASNLLRALSSSSKNKHAPSTSVSKKVRHLSTRATGHGHDEDNYNNGGRSQSAVSSSSQQLRHFNHIAYASVEDYEREVTDEDDGPTDDHPHTWESSTHHHHKNNTNNTRRRRHKSNNNNNNNASFELDSVTDSLILDDTASGNCLSKRSLNHARSITGYIPPREYLPPVFVEQYAEVIGIIDKYASMYHRQLLAERLGHEGDLRSERAWAEFSRSISKPHQPTLHNHNDDVSVVRHADRSASFATTDVAADSTTTSPEQRHRHHPHHHEGGHQDNGSFHSAGGGGGLDTGSPLRHVQAIMAADAANSQAELLRIQLDEKCNELEKKQMELEELAHWYDQSEAAAHSGLTAKMNDFTHYQRKMEDKLKVVVTQGEALLAEHQELEHILIELEERAVTAEELLGSLHEEYKDFKESVAAIPADELEEPAPPASPRADVADKSVGDTSPMKPEDSPKSRLRKAKDMKKQLEILQESLLGEGPLPSPKRLSKYEPEVLVQSLAAAQKEAAKWRAEAFGWKEHCDATEIEMVKYKTALELLAEQEQRQLQQQGSDSSRRGSSHQQQQVPSTMNTSMGSSTRSVEDEDRIRTMQMIQLAEEQVATRELLLREIEMENQKREMIKRGRRVIELPSQQQKPPLTTTASPSPTRSITYDYGNNNISNGGGVGEYSMPNTLPTHRAPSAQSVLTSTSPSLLQPNYNHLLPPPRPLDHSSTSSPQLQRHYQNNDDNDDRQQYTPSYSSRAFFDDPVKAMALMDEAEERDLQNRALHGGDAQRRQMAAPPASRQPKRVHFVSKNDSTSTSTAMDASASLSEYPPGTGQSYKSFMDAFDRRQERFDEYCKNTGISEEEYARAVQDQEADTNRRHREGIPSHMVPTYSHYVGSE